MKSVKRAIAQSVLLYHIDYDYSTKTFWCEEYQARKTPKSFILLDKQFWTGCTRIPQGDIDLPLCDHGLHTSPEKAWHCVLIQRQRQEQYCKDNPHFHAMLCKHAPDHPYRCAQEEAAMMALADLAAQRHRIGALYTGLPVTAWEEI